MHRFACGLALLVVGCSSNDTGGDVTGPYSGEVRRFDVDKVTLPSTTALQNQYAGDLDGDGAAENQLGLIVAALTQTNDTNKHVQDMIASGALASYLELQADSLDDDSTVGATWHANGTVTPETTGGKLTAGAFLSNRTATTKHLAKAHVMLPVFADADPLVVPLVGFELDLDSDGKGGFDAVIRGGIPIEMARVIAYAGVLQMMHTNPTSHLVFARLLDTNKDGQISNSELMTNAVLAGFIIDDVAIGGDRVLSVAFAAHLCPHGMCNLGMAINACTDRVKNGMESDIDCGGGTCPLCAGGLTCTKPTDCESGACDAGTCRAPTCNDALRDGFESDVDCGASCGKCAVGQKCANADDCQTGNCVASTGSTGTCGT